jgi:UDPglucose--hexose-1-phosphate uridylyltransferase
MPNSRCEVILYTQVHDATFWSLGMTGARKVIDLWAERSATLGARPDIAYVLVFENRGAAVGATIPHPHGQIYAFDSVPPLDGQPLTSAMMRRRSSSAAPGSRSSERLRRSRGCLGGPC